MTIEKVRWDGFSEINLDAFTVNRRLQEYISEKTRSMFLKNNLV